MRQQLLKTLNYLLALALVLPLGGCGHTPMQSTISQPTESVDETKTQLYVYNSDFAGGDGWLMRLKTRFEEEHALDTNWESGKTGVQVIVRTVTNRDEDVKSAMKGGDEVYFTQAPAYRAMAASGLLSELTSLITSPLVGETISIAEKMSEEQRAYYGVSTLDGGAAYYGVPYRFSHFGFVYDADLFTEKGYYFALDRTDSEFVTAESAVRSAGPDGALGTMDDGLPATYEEFFTLCDYISSCGQTPIVWGGESYGEYLTWLIDGVAASYKGVEIARLQYAPNGAVDGLGSIRNGGFSPDEEPTVLTDKNGYELARSGGNYYALQFLKKLTGTERYYDTDAFKKIFSQAEAQKEFISGEPKLGKKRVAMLADGNWWQSGFAENVERQAAGQANDEGGERADYGDVNSIRNFGWLPFPKASEDAIGGRGVLSDCLTSTLFLRAGIAEWKQPLAEEFVRFACSNESLADYVIGVQAATALSYTLTEAQEASLSYFAKSALAVKENSDIVYAYSTHPLFLQNESAFSIKQAWRASFQLASPTQYPAEAFRQSNLSVVDYFNGMLRAREESWGKLSVGYKN